MTYNSGVTETQYMTAEEVKKYLRVGTNTLQKFRRLGLRHIKIDRKLFFRRADVDAFMESHLVEPKKTAPRKRG
jgi:hypothetical protein